MIDFFQALPASVQSAAVTGFLGIPGLLLAHRLGMRKQADHTEVMFDKRMLEALQQRDTTIANQQQQLKAMGESQGILYRDLGAAQARIDMLQAEQKEQAESVRVQIAELAELRAHVDRFNECQGVGGQPCPLAYLRRKNNG